MLSRDRKAGRPKTYRLPRAKSGRCRFVAIFPAAAIRPIARDLAGYGSARVGPGALAQFAMRLPPRKSLTKEQFAEGCPNNVSQRAMERVL